MTTPSGARLVAVEEARIQEAYTRRRHDRCDRVSSWSEASYVYAMQDRERRVLTSLQRLGVRLAETRVLEVGCGTGAWIRDLTASLPFAAASFDLVLQATMFSSILEPAVRRIVAAEMLRVAGQDGSILWYDLRVNNPWNSDVRGIGRAELAELFPACRIDLRRIWLAPPLARWIAPRSHVLWLLLASVPWLCTHYLGLIRNPGAN